MLACELLREFRIMLTNFSSGHIENISPVFLGGHADWVGLIKIASPPKREEKDRAINFIMSLKDDFCLNRYLDTKF